MKRRPANSRGRKKQFSRTSAKVHKRNLIIPRAGYRL